MQDDNIIEIAAPGGVVPASIIENGYRLSSRARIKFVLHGITAGTVNRVLDRIVPTMPLTIPGVIYLDIHDQDRVRRALQAADTILVTSDSFRRLAISLSASSRIVYSLHQFIEQRPPPPFCSRRPSPLSRRPRQLAVLEYQDLLMQPCLTMKDHCL